MTNHDYDRSKLRAYATAAVKERWFVLGPEKQLKLLQAKDGQFTEHALHGCGDVHQCGLAGIHAATRRALREMTWPTRAYELVNT